MSEKHCYGHLNRRNRASLDHKYCDNTCTRLIRFIYFTARLMQRRSKKDRNLGANCCSAFGTAKLWIGCIYASSIARDDTVPNVRKSHLCPDLRPGDGKDGSPKKIQRINFISPGYNTGMTMYTYYIWN